MVQFTATKTVDILFKDDTSRKIEHIAAQATPGGFIVFEMSNGDSCHVNLDCIQTMDFFGLERARQVIITN